MAEWQRCEEATKRTDNEIIVQLYPIIVLLLLQTVVDHRNASAHVTATVAAANG